MKLRRATAREGALWMKSGVMLLLRHPLALSGQFALTMLLMGMLLGLPWIGPLLVGALLPLLTAGWVHEVQALQAGQPASLGHLLAPLRSPARPRLLKLGALHAVLAFVLLGLADLVDPGLEAAWDVLRSGDEDQRTEAEVMAAIGDLQGSMVLRALLMVPLSLLFWHAPVLVHRENMAIPKALFASALASWRNLGAFGVYALAWAGADVALSMLLGGLLTLLGLQQLVMLLAMPVALMFSTAFYASLAATVEGCLEIDAAPTVTATDQ